MKKRITTAAVAASLLGGVAIGSVAVPPMTAFAADTSTSATAQATARTPGQWISDALKGLVDKGTITQAQSDTIASTLEAAQPARGGHGPGRGIDTSVAATALGLSETDLRTQMQTKSIATIAKEKNVDLQGVIDKLVAAANTRIDQGVTDGRLTQAKADEMKSDLTTRITDSVNEVRPARGGDGPPPGDGGAPADSSASATSTTTAS